MNRQVDPYRLKKEVLFILAQLDRRHNEKLLVQGRSLPDRIFEVAATGNYPHINKIRSLARQKIAVAHAILLPGGSDVQPHFYGQKAHRYTSLSNDWRRDLFEFAMLKEADLRLLPIFGICRGMQVANVWYGGSLVQHIDGHRSKVQRYMLANPLAPSVAKGVIATLFHASGGPFVASSRHHQAVDRLGSNLAVVAYAEDGTIKALEGMGRRSIVLVQWHPEDIFFGGATSLLLSSANRDLFSCFADAANARFSAFER
jgi:gamma-glutamyl-gamma-aminobutyrate hydrolase PuuD